MKASLTKIHSSTQVLNILYYFVGKQFSKYYNGMDILLLVTMLLNKSLMCVNILELNNPITYLF